MDFKASSESSDKLASDCAIVGLFDGKKLAASALELDDACGGTLKACVASGDASSAVGSVLLIPSLGKGPAKRVLLVGLGKRAALTPRLYRRATQAALNALVKSGAKKSTFCLGKDCGDLLSSYESSRQAVIALGNSLYRFNAFKSAKKPRRYPLRQLTMVAPDSATADDALQGARHGWGIAQGMDLARDLGNTPPNVCTPTYLADTGRALAKRYAKIDVEILDEPEMQALGMGSLLSVGYGSQEPSKLIVLRYAGGELDQPPVALVGKGISFDTGGTSLKPGQAMDEMKYDMCGAAAVLGALASVAVLRLPINLLVVVASAENMPGSRASRPGDIVTSMSGKTIEILNTDAEGRLVLCDALTYTKQYKPSAIVDVATLTGACVIALGRHNSGLLANDNQLADDLLSAGQEIGDTAWRLPLGEDYAEQLHSNFADMANIGGREAGTVTAACFLSKFVTDTAWAHLDIAGTAWVSGAKKGGTGRPVPLLLSFLIAASKTATAD